MYTFVHYICLPKNCINYKNEPVWNWKIKIITIKSLVSLIKKIVKFISIYLKIFCARTTEYLFQP